MAPFSPVEYSSSGKDHKTPQLVIPDIDDGILERLRERATHHSQSVEVEAILAGGIAACFSCRSLVCHQRREGEPGKVRARVSRQHAPGAGGPRPVSVLVVYDSMYVALALCVGGQMVTADERLVNSHAGSPWAASVIRLRDVL